MRITHEAELHEASCFLTLTLEDQHLVNPYLRGLHPKTGEPQYAGTLQKKHWQDFMKRLRDRTGAKLGYFHCGEYGSRYRRPHYHAALFGWDFPDRRFYKRLRGNDLFTSDLLTDTWGLGHCVIGALTFESAAYVARYVVEKITGDLAAAHYEAVDLETGEVSRLLPEYTTMSLKPAIGKRWYESFKGDVFPRDEVIMRGREMKPPKYYDRLYELGDAEAHRKLKEDRRTASRKHQQNQTPERLKVRETVARAKLGQFKREIDQ